MEEAEAQSRWIGESGLTSFQCVGYGTASLRYTVADSSLDGVSNTGTML